MDILATAPLSKAYAVSGRYCSAMPPDGFATAPFPNTSAISVQYCSGKSDRLPQPKQVHPCTFDEFVGSAAHQTILPVGCNSYSETLGAYMLSRIEPLLVKVEGFHLYVTH